MKRSEAIQDGAKDDKSGLSKPSYLYVCEASEIESGHSKRFIIKSKKTKFLEIALFNIDGSFYALSEKCQHKGGPLSRGRVGANKIVTCPWHGWKYSIKDGKSPHEGGDSVDAYSVKILRGKVYINPNPFSKGKRISKPHKRYAQLERDVNAFLQNQDHNKGHLSGKKLHVLGISTTNANDKVAPRQSTSEAGLELALQYARSELGAETVMVRLRDLYFKDCEGYYSKNAYACIFPCSISEMDKEDQMIEVYEKMILWADLVVVASPIRWGSASSLYYKMVQRLNSVQNQGTTHKRYLIRNKTAAFIITGGQDNVQHVAGEMLAFWAQLGFSFAKFPFVGWSRGWYAEDTENNFEALDKSKQFKADMEKMILSSVKMSMILKETRHDEYVFGGVPSPGQ